MANDDHASSLASAPRWGRCPSFSGFFKKVAPTRPGDGRGAGHAESAAQAWPALPGLVKARVCARGAHKTGAVGARDQRRGQAAAARRVSGESAGVRACAERVPGADLPARAPVGEAKVRGGLGAAARARGRSRAAGPALARRRASLPVSPALPALRQLPARPLSRRSLARPAGAMAAFSKYLTARNSSLAGAAFLLLCLLHKRRRALGQHG